MLLFPERNFTCSVDLQQLRYPYFFNEDCSKFLDVILSKFSGYLSVFFSFVSLKVHSFPYLNKLKI